MAKFENLLSNLWWGGILSACICGITSRANGATVVPTQTAKIEAKQTIPSIQATGYVDLRPSWVSQTGKFTTENTAELGAKLSSDISLSYMQGFSTNLYDSVSSKDKSGMKFAIDPGAVKTKVNNIWKNESQGLSLGYENRIYLPVDAASQERGLITSVRNYLKLSKIVSEQVKLTLSEIAIPMIHSRSGNVSSDGTVTANGIFENRVYLITDIQLTEKLSLSVPVMFHQTRTANFRSDAANNSSWSFSVWTNPELDYAVSDNLILGLAYYNNDSFFTSNLSKTQFGKALEGGTFQFVLTASL